MSGLGTPDGTDRRARREAGARCAFTLVELLIVIAIIAVLIALLLAAGRQVLLMARSTTTTARMDGVLQAVQAAADVAQLHGQIIAPYRQAQGLRPGVVAFPKVGIATGRLQPSSPTEWFSLADAGSDRWWFPEPWGRQQIPYVTGDPTTPRTRALRDLEPRLTAELLALAGILPPETDPRGAWWTYAGQRSRSWNDAWGNPLAIAVGIYQPPVNTATTTRVRGGSMAFSDVVLPDLHYTSATETYGYARSLYVATAAAGPRFTRPQATADDAADRAALAQAVWTQANDVCNRSGSADLWIVDGTANAFAQPPWKGIRRTSSAGRTCFLSAPTEIR